MGTEEGLHGLEKRLLLGIRTITHARQSSSAGCDGIATAIEAPLVLTSRDTHEL